VPLHSTIDFAGKKLVVLNFNILTDNDNRSDKKEWKKH